MCPMPGILDRSQYVADNLIRVDAALAEGDWTTARAAITDAQIAAPLDPQVLHATGRMLELVEMYDDAAKHWLHALLVQPSHGLAWAALGTVLSRNVVRPDPFLLALLAFDQAARNEPTWWQPRWFLALMRHATGDHAGAQREFADTLQLLQHHGHLPINSGTVNRHNLAYLYLTLGDHARGFALYEDRLNDVGHALNARAVTRPPAGVPRWTHGDPPASLVIFAEQGAGDMFMCLRYAVALAQRGTKVVLEVFPGMKKFCQNYFEERAADVRVIGLDSPIGEELDAYVWAMSLPGLMPDVSGDVWARDSARARRLVAFAWQGSRAHRSDRVRSCDPSVFQPIAQAVRSLGFTPVAVNPGEPTPAFLEDIGPLADFDATALVLDRCAAVVSVDTSLVHLAGVLGVPTWAALAALPDWRWGLHGNTTDWYPTVRLVRQPIVGDWAPVQQQILVDVPAFLSATHK